MKTAERKKAGRPAKAIKNQSFTVCLPVNLIEQIKAEAAAENTTYGAVVQRCIEQYQH